MVDIPNRSKLKMACASAISSASGEIDLPVKIPGTPGLGTRVIDGGSGWFDTPIPGDRFAGVNIEDIDGLLKIPLISGGMSEQEAIDALQQTYPAYPIIGKFHEDSVTPPMEEGWFMFPDGRTIVESIGEEETLPSGFYLRFLAQKASAVVDTFRVNIFWGDPNA
jgi:hypothetical protein